MTLALTVRIKLGSGTMQNSADIANALESVAARFRECGYVETFEGNPGEQITGSIADGSGAIVGSWSLFDSPV